MKTNNNVVSLETAEKLKAAGFPQDTERHWHRLMNHGTTEWRPWKLIDWPPGTFAEESFAAPSAQEVADQLPKELNKYFLSVCYPESLWVASYTQSAAHPHPSQISRTKFDCTADTMAEALGQLYLKLHEATD